MEKYRVERSLKTLWVATIIFAPILLSADVSLLPTIGVDKQVYLIREPIFVAWAVKNKGSQKVKFNPLSPGGIRLKNVRGNEYLYSGPIPMHATVDGMYRELGAGDSLELGIAQDLLELYGEPEDKGFFYTRFLPAGEYLLWYEIQPNIETSQKKSSDSIQFKVIEPPPKEQEAYKLLLKARYYEKKKDGKKAYSTYGELLEKYPNSNYAPFSERQRILAIQFHSLRNFDYKHHWEKDPVKREEIERQCREDYTLAAERWRDMMAKYPDTGYGLGALDCFVAAMINLGLRKELSGELENIQMKYTRTKVAKRAKELLAAESKE